MLKLNPINQKRLRRFKQLKRAYFSFWLLVGLYFLGLCAELICNRNPYIVRFEGKTYFPFLDAYNDNFPFIEFNLGIYPEDTFLQNGILNPPNYKALNRTPTFTKNDDNYMLFSPIPYGAAEVIDLEHLDLPEEITVTFEPIAQVASVDLEPDLTIRTATNFEPFLKASQPDPKGAKFARILTITPELRQALDQRFKNIESPEIELTLPGNNGSPVIIKLRAHRKRSRPPTKVRLRIEEAPVTNKKNEVAVFKENLRLKRSGKLWPTLQPKEQEEVTQFVTQRLKESVVPRNMVLNNRSYLVKFDREDRRYPFRPILSSRHFMGIDSSGRDVFARILYALRISLNFGFILVTVTYSVGILIGSIQGYFGGWVDIIIQRFIEIWGTLPFLYVIIFAGATFGKRFDVLLCVYALFNWIGISYYMRAEFLRLRKSTFVESAKCLGIPNKKIILRHILPNATVPIITFFPFALVGAIGALSSLDYLGYGMPPPTPSWGELLSHAQAEPSAWWLIIFPFFALFTVILLGVFIGEGIRSAFDPKSTSRME